MKKLHSIWEKIPTLKQMITKAFGYKKEPSTFVLLLVLIAMTLIVISLPYTLSRTYFTGFISLVASGLILMYFMLVLMKSCTGFLRVLLSFGFVIQIISFALMIFPLTFLTPSATSINKNNVTYITYSPTCPYCELAHRSMLRAVNVYNATHIDTIKLINIDKNTKVSNEIKDYIQYKGTIIRFNHGKISQTQYTLGDSKGPVKPSASYIYNELNSMK